MNCRYSVYGRRVSGRLGPGRPTVPVRGRPEPPLPLSQGSVEDILAACTPGIARVRFDNQSGPLGPIAARRAGLDEKYILNASSQILELQVAERSNKESACNQQ